MYLPFFYKMRNITIRLGVECLKQKYQKPKELFESGDFEKSLKLITPMLLVSSDDIELLLLLTQNHMALNNFEKALSYAQHATKISPINADLWQLRANAIALGCIAVEIDQFVKDVKLSNITDTDKNYFTVLFEKNYTGEPLSPGRVTKKDFMQLYDLFQAGMNDKVIRFAKRLLSVVKESDLVKNILGAALIKDSQYDEALKIFLDLEKKNPRNIDVYNNLAAIYLKKDMLHEVKVNYRRALVRGPNNILALLNLGEVYSAEEDWSRAEIYFTRAYQIDKKNLSSTRGLATVLMDTDRPYEALTLMESNLETAQKLKDVEYLTKWAEVYEATGLEIKALDILEDVLGQKPNHLPAIKRKAVILQNLGRFSEAEVCNRRIISENPLLACSAFRSIVTAKKIVSTDPIIEEINQLYLNPTLTSPNRMELCFAIAKVKEDLGQYDEVFGFLNEGSKLMTDLYPSNMDSQRGHIEELISEILNFNWRDLAENKSIDTAPIFITGMPRSGTTLVEQIISSHSSVTGAGEVGYVIKPVEDIIIKNISKKRKYDLSLLNDANLVGIASIIDEKIKSAFPNADRITDKAIISYLYIGIIKKALPNSRFVVVRRDPRDNLLSIYKNFFKTGTHRYAYDFSDLVETYTLFDKVIAAYREVYPESFYEVKYEDLVSNPNIETPKLIDAVGLDWEDACLSPQNNERKIKTLSVFQARQPISTSSLKSWQKYETEIKPMIELLERRGLIND